MVRSGAFMATGLLVVILLVQRLNFLMPSVSTGAWNKGPTRKTTTAAAPGCISVLNKTPFFISFIVLARRLSSLLPLQRNHKQDCWVSGPSEQPPQTQPECFYAGKHKHTHTERSGTAVSPALYNKINLPFERKHLRHGDYELVC